MNYYLMIKKIPKENILWIDEKNQLSYGDIIRTVDELAKFFAYEKYSIKNKKEKEVVGIMGEHSLFQLLAFLACNKENQIPVILHPNLTEEEIEQILKKNKINYLLSEKGLIKRQNYKSVIRKWATEKLTHPSSVKPNLLRIKELSYSIKNENQRLTSEICMAVLTSGSSGVPKLLYRTYKSWAGFFPIQNQVFHVDCNTKLFFQGMLSFTGNLNVVLSVLQKGATIVTEERFDPRKWMTLIKLYSVNVIYLVPVKLKILNKVLSGKIEGIRCIFTGSQNVSTWLAEELKNKFLGVEIILYYGASELNYITYVHIEELKHKPLSLGKPFENVRIFIQNDEIFVDSVYLADSIESPATVHDMGYIDGEGDLIFIGRGTDYINKGGIKISSLNLENKINGLKEVDMASVVPYEDIDKGNEMVLFVILNEGYRLTKLRKALKTVLKNYEMPKKMFAVEEFVLNDSGKVDKKEMLKKIKCSGCTSFF